MSAAPRSDAGRHVRAGGFTLIEILVVVVVFAIMAAMAYGGLRGVLNLRRGIEDSMQRTASLQRAFVRLRQDFQNVRDRPARNVYGVAEAPMSIDRDQVLTLIRGGRRNPFGSSRSSLERVSYRVKDHKLMRTSWNAVDLPDKSEPPELALLDNVQEVRWRFSDTSYEWQTQWPVQSADAAAAGTATEPPPIAVEVTLVTKDWGELRFVFRTTQASLISGGDSGTSSTGIATSPGLITTEGLLPASAISSAEVPRGARDPTEFPDTPTTPSPSTPDPTPDTPIDDPGVPSSSGDPDL